MTDQPKSSTRGFHDRIAAVFDFDLTLADGSIDALLGAIGVADKTGWREERLQAMIDDGWDEILAKAWLLARTAEEHDVRLDRPFVEEVGRGLEAYPGTAETLAAMRSWGEEASGGGAVELHILSSGFVDLIARSPIAECFDKVWGSSLHWAPDGNLAGVKRSVIHSEKARYLLALAKGLDIAGANEPSDVHKPQPLCDWHVPLDQMLYVGDGASDIDAFNLMHDGGGLALAVDHSAGEQGWSAREHIFDAARVENLAPPDFRDGGEMQRSLKLAAEILGKRVALRRLSRGK